MSVAAIPESFQRDGFAVVLDLCSSAEVRGLIDVYSRLVAGGIDGRGDVEVGADATGACTHLHVREPERLYPLMLRSEWMRALAPLASACLGGATRLCNLEYIYKPAGTGRPTHWHQDAGFMPESMSKDRLTAWIALCDVDEGNGCMDFIPGSHLDGVHEHSVQRAEILTKVDSERAQSVKLAAGSATVHHVRTVHASRPTAGRRDRLALLARFERIADDARF